MGGRAERQKGGKGRTILASKGCAVDHNEWLTAQSFS